MCELSNKFFQVPALKLTQFTVPQHANLGAQLTRPKKVANFVILDVFRVPCVTSLLSTVYVTFPSKSADAGCPGSLLANDESNYCYPLIQSTSYIILAERVVVSAN